jgi:hypothetical protein
VTLAVYVHRIPCSCTSGSRPEGTRWVPSRGHEVGNPFRGAGGRSPLAGARRREVWGTSWDRKIPFFFRAAAGGARHEVLAPDMLVFCGAGTRTRSDCARQPGGLSAMHGPRSACARCAGGTSARPRQHKTGGMSARPTHPLPATLAPTGG